MKRKYTIENFCECIPDEQLATVMSKKDLKLFRAWIGGQGCPIGGVYKTDLKRYLDDLPMVD